jgi:hypothetical protein
VVVANQSEQISRWLYTKPQWSNHGKLLRRITGSVTMDATVFVGPIKSRSVAIPMYVFDEEA